jgi:hypothetical protein
MPCHAMPYIPVPNAKNATHEHFGHSFIFKRERTESRDTDDDDFMIGNLFLNMITIIMVRNHVIVQYRVGFGNMVIKFWTGGRQRFPLFGNFVTSI